MLFSDYLLGIHKTDPWVGSRQGEKQIRPAHTDSQPQAVKSNQISNAQSIGIQCVYKRARKKHRRRKRRERKKRTISTNIEISLTNHAGL
jgi:hypothetical protein